MHGQPKNAESKADASKEERGRSSVEFTYNGLDDVETVVSAARDLGGTGCTLDQLAAKLNQSATGGGFRMKIYSARTFGACEISRGSLELTDLGLRLVDPKHVKAARVEAFLSVPLYRLVFEALKGQQLPPPAAIERMMLQAGVAPKQKERARQVFMRSAKIAGFFDIHPDRMVQPAIHEPKAAASSVVRPEADAPADSMKPVSDRRFAGGGSFGGGGGWNGDIHPAILGLLRELPPAGTTLSDKRKDALKAAFASNIDFIYPAPEDPT